MTRREPFCPPDFVDPKPSVRRADSLDCQSSSLVSYSSHSQDDKMTMKKLLNNLELSDNLRIFAAKRQN